MKSKLKNMISSATAKFAALLLAFTTSATLPYGAWGETRTVDTADELISAVSDATAGDTIQLTADVTITNTLTIAQNLTLDLNGHKIQYSKTYVIKVTAGTLTVQDSSEGETGRILSTSDSAVGILVSDSGSLDFKSGGIDAAKPISFNSTGHLNISGGIFTRSKASTNSNYVVYLNGTGKTTITGGKFIFNTKANASTAAYCIYVTGKGPLTIEGGEFNGVTRSVVYVDISTEASPVVISGGEFKTTSTAAKNAAIYNTGKGTCTLTITGGTFTNEDAGGYALYSNATSTNRSVSITGGEFKGNVSKDSSAKGTLSITGGYFTADPSDYAGSETVTEIDETINDMTYKYRVGSEPETPAATGIAQTDEGGNKTNYDTVEEAIAVVDGSTTEITITGETSLGDITLNSGDTITVENTSDPITGSEASAKEVTITKAGGSATTTAYVVSKGANTGVVTSITKDGTVAADNKNNVSDFIDVADVLAGAVANNETLAPSTITSMELSLSKTAEKSSDDEEVAAVIDAGGVAFEVHPVAKITTKVGDEEPAIIEYPVANEQLADDATFTFTLNLGSAFANKTVVLTHYGTSGKEVLGVYTADANGYVTGVSLSSFSTVTAQEAVASITTNDTPTYYATLADAIDAVGDGEVTIELLADAELDYDPYGAYGTDGTTKLTINGNGHTLNLGQTSPDWSSLGLKNPNATLVFNNMTINKELKNGGSDTWNTYALIIKANVEMTGVTVNRSLAIEGKKATLTNVAINEPGAYYGLIITADVDEVEIKGGSITATNGGRGIKIADQYVEEGNLGKVTLSVDGMAFNTAKKAAILVSSTAGADITATNVDISNVAADKTNVVWVDEDRSKYYGEVKYNGQQTSNIIPEGGVTDYVATLSKGGSWIDGYYKTLAAAIAAVPANETQTTIRMIADETVAKNTIGGDIMTVAAGKNIVLDLNGKTISGSSTQKEVFFLMNHGTLEIKDTAGNGKITLQAEPDPGYGKESVTVKNLGGVLTLTSGIIENTTNGGASYAVNKQRCQLGQQRRRFDLHDDRWYSLRREYGQYTPYLL